MNVKSEITVVTERGQTSVPADLRKQLGIRKGQRLGWERKSDSEILVRVLRADKPDPLAMVGFARRFRRTRRTAAWMAELREGDR